MVKIIEIFKKFYGWMRSDGLSHLLLCYAIFLTFEPIIGVYWARIVTIVFAIGKEAFDYFYQKDNDLKEVCHDLACDAIGIMLANVTTLIWSIFI